MKTIDLPDGHHATFLESSELRRGHVRSIFKLIDEQDIDAAKFGMHGLASMRDAATTVLIQSWDLTDAAGADLPISLATIADELPNDVYKVLEREIQSAVDEALDLGSEPDPKSVPSSSTPAKPEGSIRGPRKGSPKTGTTV